MSLFDPETEGILVQGIVAIITLLGTALVLVGKKMGGGALDDIEELKKASLSYVTRDEYNVSQQILFDKVDAGFTQINNRLDNHIERRKP